MTPSLLGAHIIIGVSVLRHEVQNQTPPQQTTTNMGAARVVFLLCIFRLIDTDAILTIIPSAMAYQHLNLVGRTFSSDGTSGCCPSCRKTSKGGSLELSSSSSPNIPFSRPLGGLTQKLSDLEAHSFDFLRKSAKGDDSTEAHHPISPLQYNVALAIFAQNI
jgi:hypothetical protein